MKAILTALLLAAGLLCPCASAQQDDAQRKYFPRIKALAEQGEAEAQLVLGHYYMYGKGVVEKDSAEAVRWYRKAAEQGEVRAQYNLGAAYARGQGVEKDYAEAVKWYRKAADHGHANAQYNLGMCYKKGQGVERDYVEAVKWYRKAAGQGNANAQYDLGLHFTDGQGVEKDYVEAYAWMNLAAVADPTVGEVRDALEKLMTPQQIADAQKRTKELRAIIEAKAGKTTK